MILYKHSKPNGEVFYIGIGKSEKRAYSKNDRNKYWHNTVNKYNYEVEILYNNLTSKEAKNLEINLISFYGRKDLKTGTLVNMTSGGEGTYGRITSEISNIRRSKSMKGRKFTEEHKIKLSNAHKGKIISDETKLKMSKVRSKKVRNLETGEIYPSVNFVCEKFNLKYGTLTKKLNGILNNNTNFKYERECQSL